MSGFEIAKASYTSAASLPRIVLQSNECSTTLESAMESAAMTGCAKRFHADARPEDMTPSQSACNFFSKPLGHLFCLFCYCMGLHISEPTATVFKVKILSR
jgi:hypothetical protein